MRPFVFAVVPLALAGPLAAAPLATSTPVTIPGMMTATVGFVGPSEIPNTQGLSVIPGMNPIPGLGSEPMHGLPIPRASRELKSRQIRVANHDIGPDMAAANTSSAMDSPATLSQDSSQEFTNDAAKLASQVADGTLVRRQVKIMGHDVDAPSNDESIPGLGDSAILKRAEAGGAEGNPTPQSVPAAGTKAASSALLALGEARMNISEGIHSLLGELFGGDSTSSNGNPLHNVVAHARRDATASASATSPKFLEEGDGPVERTQILRRHSFMVNTDSILPDAAAQDPDGLTSTAAQTPNQAWQDHGLFEIDSNRPPPPEGYLDAVPKNATGLASTSIAPASALQTATTQADTHVGKNVTDVAHST